MADENIGWLYNRSYFEKLKAYFLGKKTTEETKKKIGNCLKEIERGLTEVGQLKNKEIQRFRMRVRYPGLITGIGLAHEVGIEGEFKWGMHFDYTYGMPIVYGSSIKGVLHSAFGYSDYIKTKTKTGLSDQDVKVLERNIFYGEVDGQPVSVYERDIFYDAVIVEANDKGRILERDTIAPHGNDPLKNPEPLSFLKIASGVCLEFRFRLNGFPLSDSKIFGENEKLELFKGILGDFGIGAKTNVGYGQLDAVEE